MTNFDDRIVNSIMLASKYPSIKRVGIFGSYAKGNYDKSSDIDLLYDYDETQENSTEDILNYVEEIDELLKKTANVTRVDYVWFKGVLNSNNQEFIQNVLRDIIWIYQ